MSQSKQDRAIQTRAAILHAAAAVFDEYGYSGASVNKILARAGVTQGAMYFHFASKEAVARAVMNAQGDDLELPVGSEGLQRLIDTTMYLSVQLQRNVLLRAGVRLAVEQGEFGVRDDTAYQLWARQFAEHLYSARIRGELLPDVDEAELAKFLVGAYSGTQLFSQIATGRVDLPQRIQMMWRFLLPGIATPQIRERLKVRPWRDPIAA
jgi:AcrR family transcriptional regulator